MNLITRLFTNHISRHFLLISLLSISPTLLIYAQQRRDSVSSTGATFKISGGRHFWMGKNYRKEWTTEVKAPVIDLATELGGLTPTKRGGGKQTRTLKLEDAQGRQYSLRSIEKYITVQTLPISLKSEAAVDLVQDGVSASYPYANLSVPVLAEAVGIPHSQSRLVYIGDDPKLGDYREDFKNMLAFLETRLPDSVKKDFSTEEVVEKLYEDNDHEVDQYALLKARILDMFVMDLDRHEGQWEWGAFDKGKGKVFYPIARDKDQAFYINEGVLPWIAAWPWHVSQLEGFKADARNIAGFNWAARNLDRFFLNELSEADWRRAVDDFLSKMTDDVIQRAMDKQPNEIKHLRWNEIIQTLKARRSFLADEVMTYYRFLSENVNVVASDKKEFFDINFNDDGSVHLQIFKINSEGEQTIKMFDRLFDASITKELRLYGMGGKDKYSLKGKEDKIKVRMIGGEGSDIFENVTNTGETGIVYDQETENNEIKGQLKNRMRADTFANQYNRLGFKYNNTTPFVSATYNRDDGLYLGLSLKIIKHGFRKEPYRNLHEFAINHALATKAFNFRYYAEFISTFGKYNDVLFDADIKAPNNTTNFFGYGANSIYDKTKPGKFRYYRARYNLGDISLLLRHNFSPQVIMTLGPTYQFFSLDSNDNKNRAILLTGINKLDPNTLFAKQSYFGGKFTFNVDTRNNPYIPQRGIRWNNTVRYLSGITNASYDVTQVNSDFTFHIPLIKNIIVFSNRFGGGHNFGDFEFYQAQYLGSDDNLRGYRKYRFAGRSKLYNNAELRIGLARFKTYLFPGSIGIMAFYDTGKIMTDNDSDDDKWLSGYGGGLWVAPFRRFVFSFIYAASKEDKIPLITMGWQF